MHPFSSRPQSFDDLVLVHQKEDRERSEEDDYYKKLCVKGFP
jgi:hypothetical protein